DGGERGEFFSLSDGLWPKILNIGDERVMTHARRDPQREEPLDSDTASERRYPVDRRSRHGLATSDLSAPEAPRRLSTGEALIAILLISLGLWAVVVAAIGTLASALFA